MPIEDIVLRIRKDAEAEKERILQEARTEAQRTEERYRQDVETRMAGIRTRAEKERRSMSRMIVSTARARASRAILEEKERLIEETVSAALQRLRGLPDAEYTVLLEKLYRSGCELTGKESRVIPCTPRDSTALEKAGIVKDAAGNMMTGPPGAERIPVHTGGVIVESVDGRVRVDNSFEALIRRKKLPLKILVSDILFVEE